MFRDQIRDQPTERQVQQPRRLGGAFRTITSPNTSEYLSRHLRAATCKYAADESGVRTNHFRFNGVARALPKDRDTGRALV